MQGQRTQDRPGAKGLAQQRNGLLQQCGIMPPQPVRANGAPHAQRRGHREPGAQVGRALPQELALEALQCACR
jgi:hypothetical protein